MLSIRKRFENPLEQYGRILNKRRLTVLTCFLLAVSSAWLYTESLLPKYAARTKVLIEDSTKWLGLKDTNQLSLDWYVTQFEILKSKPIISKVVASLDLTRNYWYNPSPLQILQAKLTGQELSPRVAESDPASLVRLIQGSVTIRPQTQTGLVLVSVSASAPELASDICNGLIEAYIEENLQERIRLSMQGTEYLSERLRKISERIQENERELEEFEVAEGIDVLPEAMPSQQLSEFLTKYTEAQSERWELEERLKMLERVVEERDFSGISNPNLDDTQIAPQSKALFEAQLQLDKLRREGRLEKHPAVIEVKERLETLQKRLVFESRNLIAGMRTDLAALNRREEALKAMVQQVTPGSRLARRKRAKWEFLRRDIDIQNGFYARYNEQLKKLQLLDDVKTISIRVVEAASVPASPYSPNKKLIIGIGVALGLVVGVFLAFFREYLDDTLKSSEDVQEYLEQPVIGTIPMISDVKDRGLAAGWRVDTSSLVSEAYRSLRTNLQFFESERPLRTLVITSPGPGEGKSTTCANIALALVQMGKRVCLVDTDMRKPVLHKLFQKSNRYGITSMFAGVTDRRRLILPTGQENLYLLPCGPVPPNPAELLASKRMEEAIRNLSKDFDYLLFDSPPVLAVTDALVLASMVDAVVVVIKAGSTRIGICQQTLDALGAIKANVVGVVLNKVNPKQFGYYPYYSKYYGYVGGGDRRAQQEKDETSETLVDEKK